MTTKAKPAKKPAAKKPAAKKPAPAPTKKKPAAKKPERAEKRPAPIEAVEIPAGLQDGDEVFVGPDAVEAISDEVISSAAHPAADELEADVPPAPPPELSDEERELSAIYDDLDAPAQAAHTEYSDRQTADEDRPLVPEINARAERKNRWEERREQRRQRRDQRRDQRQGGAPHAGGQPAHSPRPPHENRPRPAHDGGQPRHEQQRLALADGGAATTVPIPVAPAPAQGSVFDHDALARVGTPLGDAAATVFAQLRNNQPLPVKQLASMMRKRNLTTVEPDQLWPQLKAELLGDERSYRSLGLRPRIVYRGRDLFAPGPVATSLTADAEAGMAAALSRLAGATHRALAQRVARATAAGFERMIHAYLVAAGYRDIEWVKRVEGIAYATVTAPGIERTVLVSARAGDRPIDRRGIGELRVGVEAKNLVAGILFSAASLSEEAERELERAGRSISVVCGDQLIATLIAAEVGVVSRTAPLHYVDDQLLDELMQG